MASRGGADTIDGGLGAKDAVDYGSSTTGVTVTVNATTGNTGGDAAGDTLAGIEDLVGSPFRDVLTGDANANGLTGGAGNDVLQGLAGADILAGGDGADTASYAASTAAVTCSILWRSRKCVGECRQSRMYFDRRGRRA